MSRSLLGPSLKALTLLAHHILPQGFSSAEPRCEVKSQVGCLAVAQAASGGSFLVGKQAPAVL